jgi:predicted metal-dependent hydrolase
MDLCDAQLTVERRAVKHARLRVCEDGRVRLFVPNEFTEADVDSLLQKKAGWIERQREFFIAHTGDAPTPKEGEVLLFGDMYRWVPEANGGSGGVDRTAKVVREAGALGDKVRRQRWLRKFAGKYLRERVERLAAKHGFRYGCCFVLSQRTRWGSCSKKRNVSLNWRLISAPEYAIDYVILHELVHTRVMDHSHCFWVHLHAVCPEHKRAIAWLNANRPTANLNRRPVEGRDPRCEQFGG